MNLYNLNNKKIGILGLGIENQALVRYLLKHKVKCEITVCDARTGVKMKTENAGLRVEPAMIETYILWQLGKKFNQGLEKFDILFRSPGWPMDCPGVKQTIKAGTILSSPIKLFFDLCPTKNIIGVTGTKGKGTTASLIYEILKRAGKKVWLGGNIGVAPFAFIDKIKKSDWVVLELSSFQLEDMTASPRIAVITNLYPEHLAPADPNNPNYHRTLKEYRGAKMNIVKYQKSGEKAVLNYELGIRDYELNTKAKIVYFKKSELPSKLVGEHNKENVAAAIEVAKIIGVKQEFIEKAVANFKGLPHRLELVRELNGVEYYDDSFATTPESTIIALKSFTQPIVLFLGGADKGADFKELAKEVVNRVKFVVLLAGDSTSRIKKDLLKIGFKKDRMKIVDNIVDAVRTAKENASRGDIVLLSTACASFGMFKNYKERGNLFKREVRRVHPVK